MATRLDVELTPADISSARLSLLYRKVKNVESGIDISVPSHEHALAPKLVRYYHVIVITSLPHFKSAVHSEDSVVQFMVLRDYETFEQLQKDMLESFQQLKLPNLPRKFHIFIKDADIEERQITFDCLLKVLCQDKDMCTSPVFLRFLGFDPLADKTYFDKRRELLQRRKQEAIEDQAADANVFKLEDRHDDNLSPNEEKALYNEAGAMWRSSNFPFMSDGLIPTEDSKVIQTSEHSAIPDVPDTIDDILQTVGKVKQRTLTSELHVGKENNGKDVGITDVDVDVMEPDDIVAYIQGNTKKDTDLD